MRIEQAVSSTVTELWNAVEPRIKSATVLEQAAQALASEFYDRFLESVVIARVFLTVPYGKLPSANKQFVDKLAGSGNASAQLKPTTSVLSLVGTCGKDEAWCDRRKSKGHVGIPLISSSFVQAIPMIARLVKELGIPMEWLDTQDAAVIVQTIGREAGLFYADDAATATDKEGRKIIAMQDFVSAHGVKCVFGIGGAYDRGEILVIVVFCRDKFPRANAERFLGLSNQFKSATGTLVAAEKIFSD